MHGFYGRILIIDLSAGTFTIDPLDDALCRKYLGGKGLASHLLAELNPPGVDPLAPENRLIFATGPLGGTWLWGSCRYGVYTKSPQTGLYCESYAGGKVPDAMDAAGYDAIILHGASERPTALVVHPQGVEFHDGAEFWGLTTYAAEDALNAKFGGKAGGYKRAGAVVIGPAAENLVSFGVIENDYWRSAGRTGPGTVMGSKKVKGILFKGDRTRDLADDAGLRAFVKAFGKEAKESPAAVAYKSMGTPQMVKIMNSAKAFPARYWSQGSCAHWEKISADALHTQCEVTPKACLKCFMACGRLSTVKAGRHAGLKIEGPEYETIYAFGGLCLVESIEEIAYLNDICDRLGMDTITAGNLCAFTVEASRRGKIKEHYAYGDVDAFAALLQQIARREGIGDVLAQGIKHAAQEWDLEDIAVHAKGLEPAGYYHHTLKGMGLAYATSDRGACHLRSTFYKPELAGMIPKAQIEGKAKLFMEFEDRLTIFDTLILCRFYRDMYLWEQLQAVIRLATGLDYDESELKARAREVTDTVRRFNLREGLTPADDRLPKGFYRETDVENPLTPEELETMLAEYYQLRGWDADGVPLA
ncbi:MAG: aldehyde ferredoxin oxidoreductase family protein [Desulfobacterales bacterium]